LPISSKNFLLPTQTVTVAPAVDDTIQKAKLVLVKIG
jgi:hypothetical protein